MSAYKATRRWLLHELLQVQAKRELGSQPPATTLRDRRTLQRRMVELRKVRAR